MSAALKTKPTAHLAQLARAWSSASVAARFRAVLGVAFAALLLWLLISADWPWKIDPESKKLGHIVGYFSFWAAVVNLFLLAGLFATAPWWAGDIDSSSRVHAAASPRSRLFWPLVLLAVGFCAVCAGLRMDFGFAHDENYSARHVIAGEYRVNQEDRVSLRTPSWEHTLFYYKKPNNHVLHSILARLSWSTWKSLAPGNSWHVREWVIRVPAFLAGLGAIVSLALLLRHLVSARAGLLAAWLLAIHPWHIRYTSEARGYSLVLFLIPLILLFWCCALESARWRWWLAWAVAQFALVYTYPGAIYVLVLLNLLTLGWLVVHCRKTHSPAPALRWFAVNVIAAMLAIQAMLPLVSQLRAYMETGEASLPLTRDLIQSKAAHFLTGTTWNQSRLDVSPHIELRPFFLDHPAIAWTVVAALIALMILGYAAMFRRPWPLAPIVGATLLFPAFIGLAAAWLLHQWLFEWYLIYLLPGLAAGVAVGADRLGALFPAPLRVVPGILTVFGYALFSQPFRAATVLQPLDVMKQAALDVRHTLDPNVPDRSATLTAAFPGPLSYYDPRAIHLKTAGQLLDLMRRADSEQKPLYVFAGHPWACVFKTPELWRIFNESGLFQKFTTHCGYDNTRDWIVAQYAPGSVATFDAQAFFKSRQSIPDPNIPPLLYPEKPAIHP